MSTNIPETNNLGAFWGNDGVHFVETDGTNPGRVFHVPFKDKSNAPKKKGFIDPWETELSTDIKTALQEQKITTTKVNLSLPTKEIIFRTFILPWMSQNEIKSALEFEASKYIPFSLEELKYSFRNTTITEKNTKHIHVIFVAIKNSVLDSYVRVLEKASLTINVIEPAASSLIRALSFKELIPNDQTIALIEKEEVGRIIVVDNDIPQFVREFHLASTAADQGNEEADSEEKKLTKEVRISLDYFNRQNELLNVQKIFFLTMPDEQELPKQLETNLNMPVVAIADKLVIGDASHAGLSTLHAYGASIIPFVSKPTSFDLSKEKEKAQTERKPINVEPINYKSLIKVALACVPLIILTLLITNFVSQRLNKQIDTFNEKLGAYQDSEIMFIEKKEMNFQAKLKHYKKIRIESNTAHFLVLIPELLPKGAWLNNLEITYDDSASMMKTELDSSNRRSPKLAIRSTDADTSSPLVITLNGFAYSKNKNNQFRIVNSLLRNLKKSGEFSTFFESIDLVTTSAKKIDEHNVTSFKIVCRQSNEHNKSIK